MPTGWKICYNITVMNERKIALVVFLIGLILLSIGFIIFFGQSQSRRNNLKTDVLTAAPAAQDKLNNQPASTQAPSKTEPTFTEEQINQKIEATRQTINEQSRNRALTDQELYFLSFPREAAIKELKK